MQHDFIQAREAARNDMPGYAYSQAAAGEFGLRPSPVLLLGAVPEAFGRWHYGDRGSPDAGLFTIDNVTLQGDRLLRRNDRTICIPQNGLYEGAIEAGPRLPEARRSSRHGQAVLLCGPAYHLYGHWLIDFISRLYVLVYFGQDVAGLLFLLPSDIPPFARQWLSLVGVEAAQMVFYDPRNEICHVDRALIPTSYRVDGRVNPLFTDAAAWLSRSVVGRLPSPGHRNLFVSRGRWGNPERCFTDIDRIEQSFSSDGFEIVHPQEMTIVQQVATFSEARLIVGEYGTGLHNAIFSPAGALVVALRGTQGHPGFLQGGLCAAMQQQVGYLFCRTRTEGGQQFSAVDPADLDLLRSLLQSY